MKAFPSQIENSLNKKEVVRELLQRSVNKPQEREISPVRFSEFDLGMNT
jgi:hypothetical protein